MDKNEINRILHEIRKECLYANGGSCEYEYMTINWDESYISKKVFFSYSWKLFSSCSSYDKERMYECEFTLKRLPKGVSYTKKTVIEKDELQSVEPHKEGMFADKRFKTIYTIQISEAYSQKVLISLGKSRVFIDTVIDNITETQAYDFKKKVLSQYSNVVNDMFLAFKHGSNSICNSGFGKYEGDGCTSFRIMFSDYKLKPLTEEYQYLGLALAIAEYGLMDLKATELFRIVSFPDRAFIYIIDTPSNNNKELHEW